MDKICLITGGSRGLGKNIVQTLSELNYQVVYTYTKKHPKISSNKNILSLKMNLENENEIKNIFKIIKTKLKRYPSILINNAAISQEKKFEKISNKDYLKMMKINLIGQMIVTREFIKNFQKQSNSFGRIINVSSIGGQLGGKNQVHYAAAKAGLINFSKSISNLYSKKKITCNSIAIGLVKTDMSSSEMNTKDGKKKIKNIPIGRIAELEEISSNIKFLISSEASYVTGQCINLNGGMFNN